MFYVLIEILNQTKKCFLAYPQSYNNPKKNTSIDPLKGMCDRFLTTIYYSKISSSILIAIKGIRLLAFIQNQVHLSLLG